MHKQLNCQPVQFLISNFGLMNVAWFIRLGRRGTSIETLASYCVPNPRDHRRAMTIEALRQACALPDDRLPDDLRAIIAQ